VLLQRLDVIGIFAILIYILYQKMQDAYRMLGLHSPFEKGRENRRRKYRLCEAASQRSTHVIVWLLCEATKRELLFSKWVCPSLCMKEIHTPLLYFIYSTKTGKKPYNNLTN
jgi:hypothetical protein